MQVVVELLGHGMAELRAVRLDADGRDPYAEPKRHPVPRPAPNLYGPGLRARGVRAPM